MKGNKNISKKEILEILENFVSGKGNPWDWDDFLSTTGYTPEIEKIRRECISLPDKYPPTQKGFYCNEDGLKIIKQIIQELKKN